MKNKNKGPKIQFVLPRTENCKVIYMREGVRYSAVLATPADNAQLQEEMLQRKVEMKQVLAVESIFSPGITQRNHPAYHQLQKFSNSSF